MIKRKLDGAGDECSVDQKFVNRTQLYITCEISAAHHFIKQPCRNVCLEKAL